MQQQPARFGARVRAEAPVGSSSGLGSLMQFPAIANRTFPSMQPGDAATLAGASILFALAIERRVVTAVLATVFLPSLAPARRLTPVTWVEHCGLGYLM